MTNLKEQKQNHGPWFYGLSGAGIMMALMVFGEFKKAFVTQEEKATILVKIEALEKQTKDTSTAVSDLSKESNQKMGELETQINSKLDNMTSSIIDGINKSVDGLERRINSSVISVEARAAQNDDRIIDWVRRIEVKLDRVEQQDNFKKEFRK